MKATVVVYSNSGNTLRVAQAIAQGLGCGIAELQASKVQPTFLSVLRLGYATLFGGSTPVTLLGPDPAEGDLVVLASPVWAGRLAVPMRSWLAARPRLPGRAALVMTGGAPAPTATAFADFAKHARITPVATLYLSEADVRAGRIAAACESFCSQLAGSSAEVQDRV